MSIPLDVHGNEIGKLFVGGLDQSTTNESLKNYFSKFGEIEEAIVMMDHRTSRSRGFGYIKFKNESSVEQVVNMKPHTIDGKEVDPKHCNVNMKGRNRRSLKIFVGGIAPEQTEESVKTFFQSYGDVTDVNLMIDPTKQRHRGFAFVGFEDEKIVENLIQMHYVSLNGKQVEIKAMEPPNPKRPMQNMPNNMQSGGFRGGGRGRGQMNHVQANNWPNQPQQWNQPGTWNQQATWNYGSQQTGIQNTWDQNSWNQWATAAAAAQPSGGGQWDQAQQNSWPSQVSGGGQAASWPHQAMPAAATNQWGTWDPQTAAVAQNGTSAASAAAASNQWNPSQAQAVGAYQFSQSGAAPNREWHAGMSHQNFHPYKR